MSSYLPIRAVATSVLVLLVLSSFGSLAVAGSSSDHALTPAASSSLAPAPGVGSGGAPSGTGPEGSATGGSSGTPANAAGTLVDPAGTTARSALASARAAGVPLNVVYVPRPSASPQQVRAAESGYVVSPLYSSSPAPMGLAYYGLSAGPGNTTVGTVTTTHRLRATVEMNSSGVRPLDLIQSSPDGFGIQLNAVLTNVTLFGQQGYTFWTQNVVVYYPDTQVMYLVSNVWNFSSPTASMTQNALRYNGISGGASDGPNGTNTVGLLGFYYGEQVLPSPISYPFTLEMYLNSTIIDHRNAVDFGVHLSGAGEHYGSAAWDHVVFNSIRPSSGASIGQPANFTASGRAYNPKGLTDDYELTFGGPGGGSQATLFQANANLGLAYYDGTSFVPVPSAFNYGGETGETSTGASVAWSNAPGGPSGLSTYATMTTGPSILSGLWNATSPEGSYPLTIAGNPANALSVITPSGTLPDFTLGQPAVAPGGFTHTFYLAPGNYSVLTELSGYSAVTNLVDLTGPVTLYVNLTPSPSVGVYTPLWAFSNTQLAALAVAGSGTPSDPYVMPSVQPAPINATFGLYNDFGFPVYPAVLFYGTTVPVEFTHPPPFTTTTNAAQGGGGQLPATNSPPYWFWDVTNVSIVDASAISGWFTANAVPSIDFNAFSVVFYEGGHNLVANSTFHSQARGLLLYSGGTFFGAVNVGGGNNIVWGNTFEQTAPPSSPAKLLGAAQGLGLELAEPNDLLYNNRFLTTPTAWLLPVNLYTGVSEQFPTSWNVSRQPASNVRYAPGFPFEPLTGSIVGTSYQGGNFWWDYGNASRGNPYGELPYHENVSTPLAGLLGPSIYDASYLYPGGDFVPLVPFALYTVTVRANPPPLGSGWGAKISNTTEVLASFTTHLATRLAYLPNGTYSYVGTGSTGYLYSGPTPGTLLVDGANLTLNLTFSAPATYNVTILPRVVLAGATWGAEIFSPATGVSANFTTTNTSEVLQLPHGRYYFHGLGSTNLTYAGPTTGAFTVYHHDRFVVLRFHPPKGFHLIKFHARHLHQLVWWSVVLNGTTPAVYAYNLSASSDRHTLLFAVPPGTYTFTLGPHPGYTANVSSGGLTVNATNTHWAIKFHLVRYIVTFAESGLPSGMGWTVKVGGMKHHATTPSSITFALPNGTYPYVIHQKSGWNTTYRGNVTVAGSAVNLSVVFTPAAYPLTLEERASQPTTGGNVSIVSAATTLSAADLGPMLLRSQRN